MAPWAPHALHPELPDLARDTLHLLHDASRAPPKLTSARRAATAQAVALPRRLSTHLTRQRGHGPELMEIAHATSSAPAGT